MIRAPRRVMKIVAIGKRSVTFVHPKTGKTCSMPRSTAMLIEFQKPVRATVTIPPRYARGARTKGGWWKGNRWGRTDHRNAAESERVIVTSELIRKRFGIKV